MFWLKDMWKIQDMGRVREEYGEYKVVRGKGVVEEEPRSITENPTQQVFPFSSPSFFHKKRKRNIKSLNMIIQRDYN